MSNLSPTRLHSLDALRGGALLLGLFFHAAFSFFPGDQMWLVVDTQRSASVTGLAYVLHIFRMTVFFVLAGYFGRMQTYRLGTGKFVRDRLKRLGIPLLVFWPLLMISFIALAIWGVAVANGGSIPENAPPPPPLTLKTFPLTHLWFLYVLLIFYAVMLTARSLLSAMGIKRGLGQMSDSALKLLARLGLLPLIMGLPIALAFIFQPNWHPFFGIPTPDYGFFPNRVAILAYGGAFVLGWILQRDPLHLGRATNFWPIYVAVAVGLTAFCLHSVGLRVMYVQPLAEQSERLYPIAYALAIWFWTLGLLGLCEHIWSKESAVRHYIADASYWLYIIHLPIIMALQIWVSQWAWQAEIKYVMILGLSIPLMLMSYEFLVRYTFIGGVLNGRKRVRQNRIIAKDMI